MASNGIQDAHFVLFWSHQPDLSNGMKDTSWILLLAPIHLLYITIAISRQPAQDSHVYVKNVNEMIQTISD